MQYRILEDFAPTYDRQSECDQDGIPAKVFVSFSKLANMDSSVFCFFFKKLDSIILEFIWVTKNIDYQKSSYLGPFWRVVCVFRHLKITTGLLMLEH